MAVPKSFVKRGLEYASKSAIYGVPLTQLSHDELLAVAAIGWKDRDNRIQQSGRTFSVLDLSELL
jgi:hypothetical protein